MKHALFSVLLISLFVSNSFGETLSKVTLADQIEVDGTKLVLNGMGLRKKVVIKVYVAGLYLPAKESSADEILAADGARCTVLRLLRKVSKKQISGGWSDGLKANTPSASDEVKKQFDQMNGWMDDLKKGDELKFTYIPGKGTEISVKGQVKGVIPGKAFADAMFACWIGPKPPGGKFKKGLLGQ